MALQQGYVMKYYIGDKEVKLDESNMIWAPRYKNLSPHERTERMKADWSAEFGEPDVEEEAAEDAKLEAERGTLDAFSNGETLKRAQLKRIANDLKSVNGFTKTPAVALLREMARWRVALGPGTTAFACPLWAKFVLDSIPDVMVEGVRVWEAENVGQGGGGGKKE